MRVEYPLRAGQELWLPNWIPGSYMIRDFARNVVSIKAFENDQSINITKKNKSCWILEEAVSHLEVEYQVYAWDLSVRSAHFDDQHCFFNGTSVFLALKDYENSKHSVQLDTPSYAETQDWTVATSMRQVNVDRRGFGQYTSESYADLIDHPFELACLKCVSFDVLGVPHRMVFTESPANVDFQRIADDVQQICEYECRFFGDDLPPFDEYLFMTFVLKDGFGGLEHRSSTALHCGHEDLPLTSDDKENKSKDYQKFLSLCSHEYFHSWNVKRIKPAQFEDYALHNESHTELLWFFEGITSYYDELILARTGVITVQQYLEMVAKNITRYMRGSGREKQTIAESSFDAWTKFYKQDENAVNSIVSYYVKGGLIAFCLDFEIRKLSNDKNSLDDLMRLIWNRYGKLAVGVPENQIQDLAEELVGQSMNNFFNRMLYSTSEIELESVFAHFGINFQLLAESKQLEPGGFLEKKLKRETVCSLGVIHKVNDIGVEIVSVFEYGSAASAGLSNKDIIIAINDYRVTAKDIDTLVARFQVDSEIKLSFFRRDKLYHRMCKLQYAKPSVCYLSIARGAMNKNLLNGSNYLFNRNGCT